MVSSVLGTVKLIIAEIWLFMVRSFTPSNEKDLVAERHSTFKICLCRNYWFQKHYPFLNKLFSGYFTHSLEFELSDWLKMVTRLETAKVLA